MKTAYPTSRKELQRLAQEQREVAKVREAIRREKEASDKLEEERLRDIAQMLRANEGDNRPVRNR